MTATAAPPPARRGGTLPAAAAERVFDAKLRPPALPAGYVARPRLEHRVSEGVDGRLTLVSPTPERGRPSSCARGNDASSAPVAWVSVDRGDNVGGRFWQAVEFGIDRAVPVDAEGAAATDEGRAPTSTPTRRRGSSSASQPPPSPWRSSSTTSTTSRAWPSSTASTRSCARLRPTSGSWSRPGPIPRSRCTGSGSRASWPRSAPPSSRSRPRRRAVCSATRRATSARAASTRSRSAPRAGPPVFALPRCRSGGRRTATVRLRVRRRRPLGGGLPRLGGAREAARRPARVPAHDVGLGAPLGRARRRLSGSADAYEVPSSSSRPRTSS